MISAHTAMFAVASTLSAMEKKLIAAYVSALNAELRGNVASAASPRDAEVDLRSVDALLTPFDIAMPLKWLE